MVSGSGFVEILKEDMLVKQEIGYRVTLQTALMASAELDEEERDESSSGSSVLDSWIKAASIRPMIRVNKRIEEMVKVMMSRDLLLHLC